MTVRSRAQRSQAVAQERAHVYIELTKPRITMMVLLTVAIGYMLAPVAAGPPHSLLHVLIGAFLSCSGAGALNQYFERDLDGVMDRTRFRPLPSHRVSPTTVLLLGTLLGAGGAVYLAATTNLTTAAIDATTIGTYLFVYTPLKRMSPLSTPVGAIPGALPPVMGWAAATGEIGSGALLLFAVLFLWQIPHFLAIGRLYRNDYAGAGFPMLVVIDGDGAATGRQMVVYAAALLPISLGSTALGLTGPTYFCVALLAGCAYLAAAVAATLRNDRPSARVLLLTSVFYLPLLFAAMMLDGFVP